MREHSVTHASFVIERRFDAAVGRVFDAWANPAVKRRWFTGRGASESGSYELDFRPGGHEHATGGIGGGQQHVYEARYWDIVPDRRIVASYEMRLDGKRISVSLMTVEFEPDGTGTRVTLTEQGAFLDGLGSPAERERGMRELLDTLGAELARAPT